MESTKEKQKFLKSNIREEDQQEFSNYFEYIAQNEGRKFDINEFTMDELKKIVTAFHIERKDLKDYNLSESEDNNENINSDNEAGLEKIESNEKNEEQKNENPIEEEEKNINIYKLNNNPLEEFKIDFKCQKFKDAEIIHMKDLKIIVNNPVLKKDGFFSFSYYQYSITTPDLNNVVERNLSDFDWLYERMKDIYPGLIISSVPERNITNKDNSNKKLFFLNLFMNSLSHYEFIRATPIFQDFLSLPLKKFENKKKEYNNMHSPTSFKNFTNLNGYIKEIVNEEKDQKALLFYNDVFRKCSAINKLCQNFDNVLSAFENCKNAMKNLSNSFKELKDIYYKQNDLSNKYKQLFELSDKWSNGYKEQYDFIQTEMKYFFKFMEKELNESLKVYEEFKISRDTYLNKFNKMKKMKNIMKNDYSDLDILKNYYGYYLITYSNEYENLNKRHEERMNNQFIKYCENKDTLIKDYNIFYSLLNINN